MTFVLLFFVVVFFVVVVVFFVFFVCLFFLFFFVFFFLGGGGEELLPITLTCVKNWYQFLLHVKNWYQFLLHVKNIATTNHPLPLIPVEQLSADGERIFTKYWLTASGRLVQEQYG